jgi:RNA polymerase sigma factor (sigma-70 family)
VSAPHIHRTIDAVWRIESARIVASLTRMVRDLGLAEELAQDALVAALEQWPCQGIPAKPGAWLMAAAKHRALDHFRRAKMIDRKHQEIAHALDTAQRTSGAEVEESLDDDVGDDVLRLIFTACHPVLATEARVALTLRLVGGLTTDEIAHAFLVQEPTIAQRIVRAKKAIARARVPFEVPLGIDRVVRLSSVLEVIYLIFNEGYSATAGDDWMRPELCEEALRLGRVLVGLVPDEAEAHGLVSLMELQASRLRARAGPQGEPILLLDQNRSRWDHVLIHRGLAALGRAEVLAACRGYYTLQAAIAACHARARTGDDTDWVRIAGLYGELAALRPSPIVELNRAVAVGMASGPQAGLDLVDRLREEPVLRGYHLLPSVRGDFLLKLGRVDEARTALEEAASLTRNVREKELLLAKARGIQ